MIPDNFIITSTRVSRKHIDIFIAYIVTQGLEIYYVNVVNLFGWDVVFGTADVSMHIRAAKQCTIINDTIYTIYGIFPNTKEGIELMHTIIDNPVDWNKMPTTQTTAMHIQIENLPTL